MPIPGVSLCPRRSRVQHCISPGLTQPVMQCRLPVAVLGEKPEAAAAPKRWQEQRLRYHNVPSQDNRRARQVVGFSHYYPTCVLLSSSRTGHSWWGTLRARARDSDAFTPSEVPAKTAQARTTYDALLQGHRGTGCVVLARIVIPIGRCRPSQNGSRDVGQ